MTFARAKGATAPSHQSVASFRSERLKDILIVAGEAGLLKMNQRA